MKYETILVETQEGVTTITLNRPERMNALNRQMILEIVDVLDSIKGGAGDTRVIVLTGAGRGFCAGADLKDPLGPGGTGRFRRAVFDVDADVAVDAPEEQAVPGSILLLDGLFLHRSELRHHWDYSIFLRVEWVRNHRVRDRPEPGHHRYHEGQNIYFRECQPWQHASIVIDNDDLASPFIVSSEHSLEPGR